LASLRHRPLKLKKCVYIILNMSVTVVIGLDFGDEGKGKLVDYLCANGKFDICARAQGGSNAGHTVNVEDKTFKLHLVPSGILTPDIHCLIGHGCVVHLDKLRKELFNLMDMGVPDAFDRIFISNSAHIVLDEYIQEDISRDKSQGIGSTKQGIGPTYAHKMYRDGPRTGNLSHDDVLKELLVDDTAFIRTSLLNEKKILVEGANASMLDIDMGTYPFVTSSNTTIGGIISGLGIPPQTISTIIGVVKAYLTRVGNGPMPTELHDGVGHFLQEKGREFGTTTNRPRRCGWLDLTQLKYTTFLNGVTHLALTKLDILSGLPEIMVCVAYQNNTGHRIDVWPSNWSSMFDDGYWPIYTSFPGWNSDISRAKTFEKLPDEATAFVRFLEQEVRRPVSIISVGPEREQVIIRKELFKN
jgi:adenylosuccinate synthase